MGIHTEHIAKMKLSLCVLAATATAAPWSMDKTDDMAMDKPMSGKPMSGKPKSGHANKDAMKEEYGEFKFLKDMMAGVNQQNMMNVNFAPINNNAQNWVNINTEVENEVDVNVNTWGKKDKESGKEKEHDEEHDEEDWENDEVDWHSDKMEWFKKQLMEKVKDMAMWKLWELKDKMEVHWPLIKELLKNMTGRDCEEWIQYWEETYLDGHSFEDIAVWYREGHIDMSDLKMWAMEICAGIKDYMENISEEEMEQHMQEKREFLAMFGIEPEKVKEGFEQWMGMSFEMLKERIENPVFDGDMIQPKDD